MKTGRIVAGLFVLLLLAGAVAGGILVLHETSGGGLAVTVRFTDAKGLMEGDDVVYGDTPVGRVAQLDESADGVLAHLRIASDHAGLVRTGSRFWVDQRLGGSIVMFDAPARAGTTAPGGHHFTGLEARPAPDPETLPPPPARKLPARPAWLCEVRVNVTVKVGDELTEDRARKSAGVIVDTSPTGELLVLAPAWVAQRSGETLAVRWRVELIGSETWSAEPAFENERFIVLRLPPTNWAGKPASLWPTELPDAQGLLVTDFEGSAVTMTHTAGALEYRGQVREGLVAMVEGTHPAGFALPTVGTRYGAQWLSLHGAGDAIAAARKLPE